MAKVLANMYDSVFDFNSGTTYGLGPIKYQVDDNTLASGGAYTNLQVSGINFTDSIASIVKKVHDAVKTDANSRFSLSLIDSDVRVLSYSITEGL